MATIKQMYGVATRALTHGIQGYHVDNKYIDPLKIRQQRLLNSKQHKSKPAPHSKKTTFIDEIQKVSAKLPGPNAYEPKQILSKSKTAELVVSARRKTIFDEMEHIQKKYNFPAAGKYDKITIEVDKSRQKSNLSKAQNANYLDSSMRSSLDSPGVGNYNAHQQIFDHRGSKWVAPKQKKPKPQLSIKLPPVGTYNPAPVSYNLFESITDKKSSKSHFNKQQRFKSAKDRPLPFYNVLSEWGMKNKLQKKDIFSRISSPTSHRSVYR